MQELNVLYLYGYPWDYLTGRPQQIAKGLAKHGKVLYVEAPTSFLTAIRRTKTPVKPLGAVQKLEKNLYIYTLPLVLPFSNTLPFILRLNSWICSKFINRTLRRLKFDEFVTLSYSSLAVHVFNRLKSTAVFYDCADDHLAWKNSRRNHRRIESDEPRLAASADAVFVVSRSLEERFSLINKNTFIIPNGVEFEHFDISRQKQLQPNDTKRIRKPIIGFMGAVNDLFDLNLLEAAAKAKPGWSFVVIGPISSNTITTDLENIHFLGKKPYSELPSYLETFDVCIIPLNKSPAALSANPAKLFQYLASGKPVVSTDLPEVNKFAELIHISRNEKEFIDNIDIALRDTDLKIMQKRIAEARRNTWDQRVEMMISIMSRFAEQPAAKPLRKNLV